MKSIIQSDYTKCYLCPKQATEEHHIFGGNANRPKSEKYGLKIKLCHDCHNRDKKHGSIHFDKDKMATIHQIGQVAYMEHYSKTIDEFISEFGRNYL